jgi:4-amino-4-deoxy-L-arabinose transferase-like glycosyltransferase
VAHIWLHRDKARPTLRQWLGYVGVILVLVAPWYVAIIARDPRFAYHFFVDQHLVRFFMREYHVKPFWYYVPILLGVCLPWTLLTIPLARFLWSRSAEVRVLRPQALGFFVLWAGWGVLFFSISSSKLPSYILPITPAVALLVGCLLDRMVFETSLAGFFRRAVSAAPRQTWALLAVAWLTLGVGARQMQLLDSSTALLHASLATGCLVALGCWGRRLRPVAAWVCCCLLAAVVLFTTSHVLVPAWSSQRSPLTRHEEIGELVRDGQTPVLCCGGEWGSIPFYLGRDDIVFHLDEGLTEQVRQLLGRTSRYILIVRHKAELDDYQRALTPGATVTRMNVGEIGAALVQITPPSGQAPAAGQQTKQ